VSRLEHALPAVPIAAFAVALLCWPAPAFAQWVSYPTAGIPRLPNGKPNLAGTAPRTSEGKPDFSGIWGWEDNRPCPPDGCPDAHIGQEFLNIGWSLKNGLPYQPWAADLVKKRMADNSKENPDANCLPMGMAQMNAHPFPRKIIQTPTEVVLIYEGSGTTVREVFLDGRTLPTDPEPWWNGYSVGRWEGDTLVIETTGFMDDGWLDVRGSPLTSGGKIIERFHRVKYGYLELEETIDDPKAYTRPFSAKLYYRLSPDTQLIEFVCLDKDAKHYVGASPVK